MTDHVSAMADALVGLALCGRPTMQATIDLTRLVLDEDVPGDLVECGVWAGAHPALMARCLEEIEDVGRMVWLFDSFQGIPEAGPNDEVWPGFEKQPTRAKTSNLVSTGIAVATLAAVRHNMRRWNVQEDRLTYVDGWFQHTMSGAVRLPEQIALLRLDGDLYESTKACLEALYPRLAPGGVCILDDWQLAGSRKAALEYLGGVPAGMELIPDTHQPVWWRKET